jgi:hypothetical protein
MVSEYTTHCSSQSEPMHFDLDIKYRLASHLVKNCPSSTSEQQQEMQQQGPAE